MHISDIYYFLMVRLIQNGMTMDINELIQKRIDTSKEEIIWKSINGVDGYLVDQFGRIKSLKRIVIKGNNRKQTIYERILKLYQNDKSGCIQISLSINGKIKNFCIRRLVAEAFLGISKDDNEIIVSHKDNDFTNCHFSNLVVNKMIEYRTNVLNINDISSRRSVIAKNDTEELKFESVLEASYHFDKEYTTLQRKIGTQSRIDGFTLEYGD